MKKAATATFDPFRSEMAASVRRAAKQKRKEQMACPHKHSRREGNVTHLVHVFEAGSSYLLCQKCQARLRPVVPRSKRTDKDAIYTKKFKALLTPFNKLPHVPQVPKIPNTPIDMLIDNILYSIPMEQLSVGTESSVAKSFLQVLIKGYPQEFGTLMAGAL
jgi:hypothetical protein